MKKVNKIQKGIFSIVFFHWDLVFADMFRRGICVY